MSNRVHLFVGQADKPPGALMKMLSADYLLPFTCASRCAIITITNRNFCSGRDFDMQFIQIGRDRFSELKNLHTAYKAAIREDAPTELELCHLEEAVEQGKILFFGCTVDDSLVAVCSVCKAFTTYNYKIGGVFEDFYIAPEHRKKGIARKLVAYAFTQSNVASMTVGCADCDLEMYKAIGFKIPIGNMLAYEM